ncbi:metallophosphoesterase family protein [Chloroflexota bacterium]
MRIGLISDTHVSSATQEFHPQVAASFQGIDLILHAGDVYIWEVLDRLEEIAPVLAARGNGDWRLGDRYSSRRDSRLRENHVISVEDVKIGLVHYMPFPGDSRWSSIQGLMEQKFGCWVDVVVCGDTHEAVVTTEDGVLLVNPGWPWGAMGSVGILEVSRGKAEARLIGFKEVSDYAVGSAD